MRKKEAEVEALEAEVKASAPNEPVEENPHINEDEQKALAEQVKSDEAKSREISIKKMEAVVNCVSEAFHLSDGKYVVNAFADKGNKSQISLSNEDFDIVVTIKDNEKFGII
jgi:hypothetical protein